MEWMKSKTTKRMKDNNYELNENDCSFQKILLDSPFVHKFQVKCNIKLFDAFALDYLLFSSTEHFEVYFRWKQKSIIGVISKHFFFPLNFGLQTYMDAWSTEYV